MNGTRQGDALPTTVADELKERGSILSVTEGSSMRPLFRTHRDAVVIETPKRPIRRFDVVLYRSEGRLLLHRVVGKKDGAFRIRGDNTFRPETVPEGEILGVLTAFVRKGKRHTPDEFGYRLYVRVWNAIYPLRFLYAHFRHACGKVLRKLGVLR